MNLLNNKIGVRFEKNHNLTLGKGIDGLDIVRADLWLHSDGNAETHTKYEENVNYLETKPQIAVVIHPSAKHDYKCGDKLFVHYMGYETAEMTEYGDILDTDFILFQIMPDETFETVDGVYLGEQCITEEIVTTTGIILGGGNKEGLKVKITHVPKDSKLTIGETVITIDEKQYELNYWGKKYIKLVEHEIVGVLV